MVRKLPVSIRARKLQQTAIGRNISASTSSGFIGRERTGFGVIQAQRLQAEKQRALDNVVAKISTLSNINDINAVLNSAPSIIRTQLEELRRGIAQEQNKTISRLQVDLSSKQRSQEKYRQRRKKASRKDDERGEDRARVREEEYEAEARELERLLRQMRAGNLFDYGSVISRVNAVGKNERQSEQNRIDRRNAEAQAQKNKIKEIQRLGLTPVVNSTTGKLLGYQGGKDTGFTEYRFNKKGQATFFKSNRFTPVKSGGIVTGFVDNVAKMSIPAPLLDRHIANINKAAGQLTSIAPTDKFNFAKEAARLKALTGVSQRAPDTISLANLERLRKKFNSNIVNARGQIKTSVRNNEMQRLADLDRIISSGKGTQALRQERQRLRNKTAKNFQNISTWVLSTIGRTLADAGLGSAALFKALKQDPEATLKAMPAAVLAVVKEDFNRVASRDPFNIGEVVIEWTIFGEIGKALGKTGKAGIGIGRALSPKYFGKLGRKILIPPTSLRRVVVTTKLGRDVDRALTIALKNTETAKAFRKYKVELKRTKIAVNKKLTLINNKIGKKTLKARTRIAKIKLAKQAKVKKIKKVSVSIKSFFRSGAKFPLPKPIQKTLRGDPKLRSLIEKWKKFRAGSLNAAFLKARNAQLTDKARGTFRSVGKATRLQKNIIDGLWREVKGKGFGKSELIDGSYYIQKFRVPSDVPKYDALIKIARAKLKGKTIRISKVNKFYEFERHGIVVANKGKDGIVRAFAIEFNKVGSRISHIGFKTAVGKNKVAAIKIYKKARKVKGIPTRVKFQDVFLVKNKFQSRKLINQDLLKIINGLETKKVFLKGQKVARKQLVELRTAIIKDFTKSKNFNLERVLNKMYKDKGVTSKSGFTASIKFKKVRNTIQLIPSTAKKPLQLKVVPKGRYVEIGYSKLRIPSIKKIRIIKPKPKPRLKRKPRKAIVTRDPITIKVTKELRKAHKPVRKRLILEPKRGITKTELTRIKTAVKSIQVITKPATRSLKAKKTIPKMATKNLIRNLSVVIPLVASKNKQALKSVQKTLTATLKAQQVVTAQKTVTATVTATKQIQQLQSSSIKTLTTIKLGTAKILTPIRPGRPSPKRPLPAKKKKPPVRIRLKPVKKKVVKRKKVLAYNVLVKKGSRFMRQNKTPLRITDAKDLMAYILDTTLSRTGKIMPVGLVSRPGAIRANISGYFSKNRRKFRVFKRKEGKKLLLAFTWIEKRKHALDTKREKRSIRKRKVAKKKVARRKPVRKKVVKRKPTRKRRVKKK